MINKPFQLGFAVLEYSKLHMYRTYATLKDWFGPRMQMLYTDTDSFILQFIIKDFTENCSTFRNFGAFFTLAKFLPTTRATSVRRTTQTEVKWASSRTR